MLLLPPCANARQRAALHAAAEACGLKHASQGEGAARRLLLESAASDDAEACIDPVTMDDASMDDGALETLLGDCFGGQLAAAYRAAMADRAPSSDAKPARAPSAKGTRPCDVSRFAETMRSLLEQEQRAEVACAEQSLDSEAASSQDRVLPHLRLADVEPGLLGRSLLVLVNNKGGGELALPPHRISANDIARLLPNRGPAGSAALCEGVVVRVRDDSLVLAVDEVPDSGLEVPLRLEKLANTVTYDRMKAALSNLEAAAARDRSAIVDVCFDRRPPPPPAPAPAIAWHNPSLDAAQRLAVLRALRGNAVSLIHGPPGTGKTTAVVELVLQEVARGGRVLACAASNVAVDNLVERLARAGGPGAGWLVRAGHPARLLPQVLEHSLEARVLASDGSAIARDCQHEMRQLSARLVKLQGKREEGAARRELRRELKALAKESRKRQEAAVREVLRAARVLCCTLTGLDGRQLAATLAAARLDPDEPPFDLVVVDEAGQALEPACWAALLRARRAVLVGDHLQLPPTVTSREAAEGGLARTLFERLQRSPLFANHDNPRDTGANNTMLTVQYRMHADIMDWASGAMYDGRLEAHTSVAGHGLPDLVQGRVGGSASGADRETSGNRSAGSQGLKKNLDSTTSKKRNKKTRPGAAATKAPSDPPTQHPTADLPPLPLLLIDTAGCDAPEQRDEESASLYNEREAEAVLAHAGRLLSGGLRPGDVGVITPYAAQASLLRRLRPRTWAAMEVSTVDGFQGREKEAILVSCVRSSDGGGVGFLADARRMNVAITRARRHCALVGDSETLGRDDFLRGLLDHFEARGSYESAAEVLELKEQWMAAGQ